MLLNVAAFQAGWFACILGAANDRAWVGTLLAAGLVGLHVAFAPRPVTELAVVALAVATGAICDSFLAASGWLSFASPGPAPGFAPHWILAMWALFATTLNVSLRWLRGRWMVAGLLGVVVGPLSYLGGARLGAVDLVHPRPALAALALVWGIVLPALLEAARRLDNRRPVTA